METTAFYLEHHKLVKPLMVETSDIETATLTFAKHLGCDTVLVTPYMGKGKVVQNTTVKSTYFKKFWDLTKHHLDEYELVEAYKPCECCGK